MNIDIRMVQVSALSIVGWELLKIALNNTMFVSYYRREAKGSPETGGPMITKMKLRPWDKEGIRHFERQGYTRTCPLPDEPED